MLINKLKNEGHLLKSEEKMLMYNQALRRAERINKFSNYIYNIINLTKLNIRRKLS